MPSVMQESRWLWGRRLYLSPHSENVDSDTHIATPPSDVTMKLRSPDTHVTFAPTLMVETITYSSTDFLANENNNIKTLALDELEKQKELGSPDDRVTVSTLSSPSEGKVPGPPIIRLRRSPSAESKDNPFTDDGELAKTADYILRHSTISRTEIRISDPDLSKGDCSVEEETIAPNQTVQTNSAAAPRPKEINVKQENGKKADALSPQSVEVEVSSANASQPQPQQAEQVKLKEPKCKCCTIM